MRKLRVILMRREITEGERNFCRSERRLARGPACWCYAEYVLHCHGCGELSESLILNYSLIFAPTRSRVSELYFSCETDKSFDEIVKTCREDLYNIAVKAAENANKRG